ncbi:hypothetical protein [Desulfosarcina ovata]|uniref:hypothetical protein n=1 Tax=Desulfosarcina ovata TaxID=83564 RepID=UPI001E5D5D97|nr:hypothetical protein [Desulfosarcina ovata]
MGVFPVPPTQILPMDMTRQGRVRDGSQPISYNRARNRMPAPYTMERTSRNVSSENRGDRAGFCITALMRWRIFSIFFFDTAINFQGKDSDFHALKLHLFHKNVWKRLIAYKKIPSLPSFEHDKRFGFPYHILLFFKKIKSMPIA